MIVLFYTQMILVHSIFRGNIRVHCRTGSLENTEWAKLKAAVVHRG
jgi:hypothetical protein